MYNKGNQTLFLEHCIFAFEMFLPTVVLCTDSKPSNFFKMSNLLKTPLIKVLDEQYCCFSALFLTN